MRRSCRSTSPTGDTTFALSQLAQQAGSGRLVWRDLVIDHARLHADLQVWIYRNQTLTELARPSLITVFVVSDRRPTGRDSQGRAMVAIAGATAGA